MQMQGFIHAKWDKYFKKWEYAVFSCDMTSCGYVPIQEVSITFESPSDRDLKLKLAAIMQKHLNDVRAEHALKEGALQQEIQELLALEDKSNA